MTTKKRFIIQLALLIIAVATVATVSIVRTLGMYTVTTGAATNKVTLGNVDVTLYETGFGNPNSPDEPVDISKGQTVKKNPFVGNTGTVPVWVRLTVAGSDDFWFTAGYEGPDSEPEVDTHNVGWDYYDGFWYWWEPLKPVGETATATLFDWVTLKSTYNGNGSDLDIAIRVEAVQADWIDSENGYAGSAHDAFLVLSPTPTSDP